jgi:hypothetical protein
MVVMVFMVAESTVKQERLYVPAGSDWEVIQFQEKPVLCPAVMVEAAMMLSEVPIGC